MAGIGKGTEDLVHTWELRLRADDRYPSWDKASKGLERDQRNLRVALMTMEKTPASSRAT